MPLPSKREAFESALAGSIVLLHAVAVMPGLELPTTLLSRPSDADPEALHLISLRYSHGFHLPGFEIDETGIRATLSFSGTEASTFVPWSAVAAVIEERTMTMCSWPVSVAQAEPPPPPPARKGGLRLVSEAE